MKEHADGDNCTICKGLIPIGGRHNIVLDDIKITACETCYKIAVGTIIDVMHRVMRGD